MDGYYAWMIVATALVLMMTDPGTGTVLRRHEPLEVRAEHDDDVVRRLRGSSAIVFVLWGWSEGLRRRSATAADRQPVRPVRRSTVSTGTADSTGSSYIGGVMFQLTFAAITVALISGAIADRVKLSSWIVFVPLWVTLCYFPIAHQVRTRGGGLSLSTLAAQDYAGGTVVHINAGIAGGRARADHRQASRLRQGADAAAQPDPHHDRRRPAVVRLVRLQRRLDRLRRSDDRELDTAQFMSETGFTFLNTTIATCAAMLGWLLMERILHGKATSLGAASGIVAGLVAITPSCGAVEPRRRHRDRRHRRHRSAPGRSG